MNYMKFLEGWGARHVKNLDKKVFKKLTLAKILCWTFRQLLLPSSTKDNKKFKKLKNRAFLALLLTKTLRNI